MHDTSNTVEAEQSFRAAIEKSRRQAAKQWELRATTSLRVAACATQIDRMRHAMLADIDDWFTARASDTAD